MSRQPDYRNDKAPTFIFLSTFQNKLVVVVRIGIKLVVTNKELLNSISFGNPEKEAKESFLKVELTIAFPRAASRTVTSTTIYYSDTPTDRNGYRSAQIHL